MEQPSREEWGELYEAAVTFRDAAPWEWMWDSGIFGVQDPESGEIGYCCVMGRLGEHYALAVYRGSEGLAGLWEMREAGPRAYRDPVEVLATQDCLMASFEDRSLLRKQDLEVIKALGLKIRGRNAWPLFRSYRPGFEPWILTAPEARFLIVCLSQALEVTIRLRENPYVLPKPEPEPKDQHLVRVPEKRGDQWVWSDSIQRPVPVRPAVAAALPPLDEARLLSLRQLPANRGVLQIGAFYTGAIVKEEKDERPWYPQVVLVADVATGLILGMEMKPIDQVPAATVEQLLAVIERMGQRPDRLEVHSEENRLLLKPVAERLGVRVLRVRRLAAIETVRRELTAVFSR